MEDNQFLIKAIFDIYRISQGYITPRVAKYDISRGQWYFLNKLLLDHDGISQEELSDEMNVDSAHTTRAIKRLEESGLIFRKTDDQDARKKNVFVTQKAMSIKDDYHNIYKGLNEILLNGFSKEELQILPNLLYKMRDNIILYMKDNNLGDNKEDK
mgnify:CR=1 FL=1